MLPSSPRHLRPRNLIPCFGGLKDDNMADAGGEHALDFDFDAILHPFDGFPDGLVLDSVLPDTFTLLSDGSESSLSDPLPPLDKSGVSNSPVSGSDSSAAWVGEIERFLLVEEEEEEEDKEAGNEGFEDRFFAGVFDDGPDDGKDEATAASGSEEGEGSEKREARDDDDSGEHPINKKRRRQMRNRDSAMKSRERKKMYIKELEMKSRYLESECRRLDHALRCCVAENLALHQCLQKDRASGAHAAKQESAVLFMESLLLGSLFWLVSIVSLFLVPILSGPDQKDANRMGMGSALAQKAVKVARAASDKLHLDLGLGLGFNRRRWRGMRTRMKFYLFPLHAAYA